MKLLNILTFDIEDWLTSSLEIIPHGDRLEFDRGLVDKSMEYGYRNTKRILEILDKYDVKATFFVLSSFGEKFPQLVREIHDLGHEVASHSHLHRLVYKLTPKEFRKDLEKSKKLLEDIIGAPIYSFRAPYFSITPGTEWVFEVLNELGFRYDSSVFPVNRKLYGYPNWPEGPQKVCVRENRELNIFEFPISTIKVGKVSLPWGGGGYYRLLPYSIIQKGIEALHRRKIPAVIYFHPYELNPEELRDKAFDVIPFKTKFIQNIGRRSMIKKIDQLLKDFKFTTIQMFAEKSLFVSH